MKVTFRSKLFAIVGSAALAFLVLVLASSTIATRVENRIDAIEQRYLPRIGLLPKLEADFEGLRRAFQDAVAARDAEALDHAHTIRDGLYADLARGAPAIDTSAIRDVHAKVDAYYEAAYGVSRRMLAGEAGEGLVEEMTRMQAKQVAALAAIRDASRVDRAEVAQAFADVQRTQATGTAIRLVVSFTCLAFVMILSLWLSRGTLRSLEALTSGFARFGRGEFEQPIAVATRDELAELAERANGMAENLARLVHERDRADRVKHGDAGLGIELRGEQDPAEVARRAVTYVAGHLEAVSGAVYWAEEDGTLQLAGHYARAAGAASSFAKGTGLVGQAALATTLTVVKDPPKDYLRIESGTGEGSPRAIVLLPLRHGDRTKGVLELAFFKPWTDEDEELVVGFSESIAIAMEMARSATATRRLLEQTQALAKRLAAQEDRLRATNEELEVQQGELRIANADLTRRTEELEAQRIVLEERNVELADARRKLEQKATELARVSTYKSQFLANMSHELRTPLNSMLLLSKLLWENDGGHLTEKQVEFSRTIHAAGNDLLALINQVLDLAKVESGKQEVRIADVPLAGVADHVQRVFTPLAQRKGLSLVVEVSPDLPKSIATDVQRLTQILNNLVGNAIKFCERGEVALRVVRHESGVAFAVHDTGIGIPPEHQRRIFAPFEQVDGATDRSHGGTGLGLAISKELARLLGGDLKLTSEPGHGSTFTCVLPLDGNVARPRGTSAVDDREALRPEDVYLLVVEDDPHFAARVGEVIHAQGLKYLLAGEGRGALQAARARPPAGIVLDVRLPDVDGWAVMEELQRDPLLARVPVHFVSAMDAAERGLAMGAVGYLTKPATQRDLSTMIDSLAPKASDPGALPILVVETAPDEETSITTLLARRGVGGVRSAKSSAAALDAAAACRFSCIIVDAALPEMRGLELLERLRECFGAATPPICIYATRPLDKSEVARLEAYAEAIVLEQGSSAERLLEEIRLFARRLRDGVVTRSLAPLSLPSNIRFDGRSVLVVDDDMRTVYALSAALRAKGIDIVVADTGVAALAALDERPDVDAVLMDIMMPEMDGYEAMRQIRARPRFRGLPIIALTAKAMKDDKEKCIEAGATEYLPKPVDASRLLVLLQRVLERRRHAEAHGN